MSAKPDFDKPDFAFPATVEKEAMARLNSPQPDIRMKAVMEIVTAKSMVSRDSLAAMPAFIAEMSAKETAADYKGLLTLYRARILADIYNSNSWQFDRVDSPLEPLPDDIMLWSGGQFRAECTRLVDEAGGLLAPYGTRRLEDYSLVVDIPKDSRDFFPYLRDFYYSCAAEICPSKSKDYEMEACRLSSEGSPEWAVWVCREKDNLAELQKLYSDWHTGLAGAYILNSVVENFSRWIDGDDAVWAIDNLKNYLSGNSPNSVTPALDNKLKELTLPRLQISSASASAPGAMVEVVCEYGFTPVIGVELLKLSSWSSPRRNARHVELFAKDVDETVIKGHDTISFRAPEAGYYLLRPYLGKDAADKNSGTQELLVTPWVPILVGDGKRYMAAVADYESGEPVRHVDISLLNPRDNALKSMGSTNSDGLLDFAAPARNSSWGAYPLVLSDGNTKKLRFQSVAAYVADSRNRMSDVQGSIFVSRPVYHQGDTVEWAVMATVTDSRGMTQLMKDDSVTVTLYDVNYTKLVSKVCRLDDFGRASGAFELPVDRLTGRYRLEATHRGRDVTQAFFMVSDFKMAVFEIKDLKAIYKDGVVEVSGNAMRFSGAPMPDAMVALEIYNVYSDTLRTAADGSFSAGIPVDSLPEGFRNIGVSVTSPAGELVESGLRVRFGREFDLEYDRYGQTVVNMDKGIVLPVRATDVEGNSASMAVDWVLKGEGTEYRGRAEINPSGLVIADDSVAPGTYVLDVFPAQEAQSDSITGMAVELYSIERNDLPAGLGLLLPEKTLSVEKGTIPELVAGLGTEGTLYVFYPAHSDSLKAKQIKLGKGFAKLHFNDLPDNDCVVTLARVVNGRVFNESVRIVRTEPRKARLEGASWRDNLIPGSPEQWTLKFTVDGRPAGGAMVATMYNEALNQLYPLSWPAGIQRLLDDVVRSYSQSLSAFVTGHYSTNIFGKFSYSPGFALSYPAYMFMPRETYGHVMYKSAMMAAPMMAEAIEEEDGVVESSRAYSAGGAVNDLSLSMADSDMVEVGAETTAGEAPGNPDFEFRDSETLQALWMPSITIDDNGEASIHFVVPNAVGSWSFHAIAWNDRLAAPQLVKALQASKPVMVAATVPRFLRRGDEAVIKSTVINNSDEALDVEVVSEIFNPATGTVLSCDTSVVALSPGSQSAVDVRMAATPEMSSAGFRVRAQAAAFSDGEQWEIPVLDALTTAIDSEIFYLSEETPEYDMTIPADKSGKGSVALEYCQNPVWNAVKSLPGMYQTSPITSLGAASSAYAAFVARSLYHRYPSIRQALDLWMTENDGEALISKLEKNEDLKLLTLQRTPFVGAADANTQQMRQLALTFDKKEIEAIIKAAVAKLESLQMHDGGFAWGSWSTSSSLWITEEVLTVFGRLYNLGCTPDDSRLTAVLDKAFAYLDATVGKKGLDYDYALAYSLFRGRRPSTLAGVEMIDRVKRDIVKRWKKEPVADKAVDAIILSGLGSHAVAKEIMRSIAEFCVNKRGEGTLIPSVNYIHVYAQVLEAFANADPDNEVVAGIRQWLILNTRTLSDMGSWSPSTLVAAILKEAPEVGPADVCPDIKIDGEAFVPDSVESYTGAFTRQLGPCAMPRRLEVALPAGCKMAYGAVVSVGTVPLSEVKPAGSKYVSVSKRFLVMRDGEWKESRDFRLGEKVRVQLIVKTDRPLEYVSIADERPAAFEPVDQMPGWVYDGQVGAYRESGDNATNLFISWLPKGAYHFSYDTVATYGGSFASGVVTIQSQQAPEFAARSGASIVSVAQ